MFRDFVTFLVGAGLPIFQVNHFCLIAFMEYIYQNDFFPANIHNYLAGVRAQFIVYNLDTSTFSTPAVTGFFTNQSKLTGLCSLRLTPT